MKKILTIIGLAAATLAGAQAQVVLTWNFADDNAVVDSGTPVNFSVSALTIGNSLGTVADPVNSTSASGSYTGATGTGNIGNAYRIGALNTGTSGSGYIEFTLTPIAGYTIKLTNFDFGVRSTSTGPQAFALRSSQDSYATDLFTGTISNNSAWTLKDNSVNFTSSTDGAAVTFRLYGYNGTGSPGSNTENGRFDDITMTVEAVPEPQTWALMGIGGAFMLWNLRRRRGLQG